MLAVFIMMFYDKTEGAILKLGWTSEPLGGLVKNSDFWLHSQRF